MSTSKKLAAAALTGLFTASIMTSSSAFAGSQGKASCKSSNGCKGNAAKEKANCKTADGKEKHACKGLNSCAGNGSDGKNTCKGHGSCATNGKKE